MTPSTLETIGMFHPTFLHFPIVLFTAALVTDLFNYFGKARAFKAGHWLIIAGVIMCIPTLLTGLAAAEKLDPHSFILERHRFLGYATLIASSLYAGLRISAMRWSLSIKPSFYIGLSVLLVALVSWTADYGGLLTHGITPFSALDATETATPMALYTPQQKQHPSSPQELSGSLGREVSVFDVVPIFLNNQCQQCHRSHFSNGYPVHFFDGGADAFLKRNGDGTIDIQRSLFYQMVILDNTMPIRHGERTDSGLSPSERLILLRWLENGAPMK